MQGLHGYRPCSSSHPVTHGCIIATIRLFINDVELPGLDPSIQEVVQIVQSALSREQELENKLASMQEVLNAARQLATESMIVSSAVNSVPFEHCIFCGDPFSVSGKKFLWMELHEKLHSLDYAGVRVLARKIKGGCAAH